MTLPAVMPGVITGSLLMFILALNEFLVSLLLVDARIMTLPVQIYNSIRSIITPDLAAISVVFVVVAAIAVAAARPPGRPRRFPQIEVNGVFAWRTPAIFTSSPSSRPDAARGADEARRVRHRAVPRKGPADPRRGARPRATRRSPRFARELDKADVPADGMLVTEAEFDAAFARSSPDVQRGDRVRRRRHPHFPRGAAAGADVAQGGDGPAPIAGDRWHPIPSVGALRAARQGRRSRR